jgi:hypothetical protein
MAIVPIAPWLTGLQAIALLVTGDLQCTAESLRREGSSAGAQRVPTADEARMAGSVFRDGSKLTKADRLAVFRGDIWAWGGPSLRNLELQCGDALLVSEAVQTLRDVAPTLGNCDQVGRPIDHRVLSTHHLEEQPEGFLQLVGPGRPGQPPVGTGTVPRFSTSDLLSYVRQSLRSNPRFSEVVSLADQFAEDGTLVRLGELTADGPTMSKTRASARRGAPPRALLAARDGLRQLYGDVVPPDVTEAEMEIRLRDAGIRVSGTTIRRALGRRAAGK